MKRNQIKITLMMATMLGLMACHQSQQNAPNRHNTLVRDNAEEPYTLDPAMARSIYSANVLYDIGEGLMNLDQANKPVPGVAYKWSVKPARVVVASYKILNSFHNITKTEPNMVYTFYLRKNARWSNGKPVTAQDFVFELRRVVAYKTASPMGYKLAVIKNAQAIMDGKMPADKLGVKAINSHELQITLAHPAYYFLSIMADPVTYPIYPPAYKQYGKDYFKPAHYVSNGAYHLKEWVHNGHLLVAKNKYYWDAKDVHIPYVKFLPQQDASTAYAGYKTGAVDYLQNLPTGDIKQVKRGFHDQIYQYPQLGLEYLDLNLTRKPMKGNLDLRKALSMVINRKSIVKNVTREGDIPSYAFFPLNIDQGLYKHLNYKWATWSMDKRIAEAKKLYKKAGYGASKPLSLTIEYNTNPMVSRVMQAVGNMWHKTLGVNVTYKNMEHKVFEHERAQHNYASVARDSWIADFNTIDNFAFMWECGNIENASGYCNKQYDQLIAQGQKQNTPQAAVPYYSKALKMVMADYAIIPIYVPVNVHAMKPYVLGYHPMKNYLDIIYDKWFRFKGGSKP